MTIYHKMGRKIEIVGADLEGNSGHQVWWAYASSEFDSEDGMEDRHRGIQCDPINQLRADEGMEEVMEVIEQLPGNRVKGEF